MDELKQLLYESFDRELSKEENLQLTQALDDSESLRKERIEIIELRTAFGGLETPISKKLEESVLKTIEATNSSSVYPWWNAVAVAAIFVAVVGSWWLMKEESIDRLTGLEYLAPEEMDLLTLE